MTRARWLLLAVAALLVVAVAWILLSRWSANGLLVDLDQPQHTPDLDAAITPDQPVGQTFVARHGGLTGIEFLLVPGEDPPHSLSLHLRADPQASDDMVTATLQLPPGAIPGFYRFLFPALGASHGQYYYAFLKASPDGAGQAAGLLAALTEGPS